jgi:hypothetical protein
MTVFERMSQVIERCGELSVHGVTRPDQSVIFKFANYMAKSYPNSTMLDLGTNIGNSLAAMVAGVCKARQTVKDLYSVDVLIQTIDNASLETFDEDRINRLIPMLVAEFGVRIEFMMADDADFLESLPDQYASFIFHDTLHTYAHLSKMLRLSIPKTIKGGCIAGHDYNIIHPEVMQSVDEWRKREIPITIAGTLVEAFVWWSRKL